MTQGAPYAAIHEIDESSRVPAGNGIYGAFQIPANIGTEERFLATSVTDFLSKVTVNGKPEIGCDSSLFEAISFLKVSDKCWIKRVVSDDALYGGLVSTVGSSKASYALSSGLAIPEAYTFGVASGSATNETATITTKADYNGNLAGKYVYLTGQEEFVYLQVNARSEVFSVTTKADVSANLAGKFFVLPDNKKYVWFKVGTTGTDPGLSTTVLSGLTGIEVDIALNDTASTIGAAIVTALSGSGFTGVNASGTVTITKTTAGATSYRANAGTTGFTVTTTTVGLDQSAAVTITGKTGYAAQYDGGASANTIATAVKNAISGSAKLTATVLNNVVTTTYAYATGPQANCVDGDNATGFAIATTQQGSNEPGAECMLLYFENRTENSKYYAVKIFNHEDYPDIAPIAGTFVIRLYKTTNLNTYIESHTCSRIETKVDGNNRNIYVEKVLKSSNFIRCIDNTAVDANELPQSVTTAIAFGGGTSGSAVTSADMINAAQDLLNKDKYEVSILMDGGWNTSVYKTALDTIAKTRGDAVAITSIPYYLEDSSNYLNDILEYRAYEYNLNSSYSAVYSPNVEIYDNYNDRYIYIGASGYVGGAISNADKNFKIWYPVMGYTRGGLTDVNGLKRNYTSGELDTLYNNQINPIKLVKGKGFYIWGQKTTQSTPSDLDRLNVRLLLISIKPSLLEFLETMIGELNTDTNRDIVKSRVDNYMDIILAGQGVYAYKTTCNEDNNTPAVIDNNQMRCTLQVQPTKGSEFIDMDLVLTPTGVTFS
jgi:hypothetical protein